MSAAAVMCLLLCGDTQRRQYGVCRGRTDSIPAKKVSTNTGGASVHREGMNVHVLRTDMEDFTDHRAYHG